MMMWLRLAFSALLLIFVAPTCLAQVVEMDVVIESVDPSNSQMAATRKEKTLQLDIADNVVVIIKGQQKDLAAIGQKQPAKITYETLLQVVTKVEISQDAQPELTFVPLKEICTPRHETGPWISADGLRIYWHVRDGQSSWIWTANRPSQTGVFGDAQRLFTGADATLTADELQMIFLQDGKLHSTQRRTVNDQFERPSPISELAVFDLVAPCISANGLTLYADQGSGSSRRICQVERISQDSSWGEPKLLYSTEDHELTTPFVTQDGKLLFASTNGGSRVKVFRRDDTSKPFAFAGYAGTSTSLVTGVFPRYCEKTNELIVSYLPDERPDREIGIYSGFDPATMVQSDAPDSPASVTLDGNWTAVREQNDGKMMDQASFRRANKQLVINGDKFLLSWSGQSIRGTISLVPDSNPMAADFSGKFNGRDVVLRAIVEVAGDKMQMCYRTEVVGAQKVERPNSFETSLQSKGICVSYERK